MNRNKLYTSPEVEVIETQMQAVICQSSFTQQYQSGTWNN